MKKVSPILCFLSCLPALAEAKGVETEYNVSLNNFYGYTDYSKPYNKLYKQNNLNSGLDFFGRATYEINEDYALSLIGYLMADTAKELENYNQGVWGEEVFAVAETPYGDLTAGQDYNVAYNFAVGAPSVGAFHNRNSDLVNFITNPNWYKKGSKSAYKTLNSTYINTDGASMKMSYATPEFMGMKLGATYVPETYSQTGLVAKQAQYKDEDAYILGAYGGWDLFGYELETSLGFAEYSKNDTEYSTGVSIYRKGWTVGASYRKTEVKSGDYAINKDTLYDAYREGHAYDVGLSYTFGPITSGITYFESKSDISRNKNKVFSFANKFQYNKNVAFSLTAAHLKAEGENKQIENNSKGYAFIAGLELSL